MKILAHRGLWHQPEERNRPESLRSALSKGFGLETDVRDSAGKLVVCHDPVTAEVQFLSELLTDYQSLASEAPLAINIKADGLGSMIQTLLDKFAVESYFCFDMSIPETLQYRRRGLRFFTRESEYEQCPALYTDAAGVWMDMFHSDWILSDQIHRHLDAHKEVAIVSPELHGRPHLAFWGRLRESNLAGRPGIMLCTDFPESAQHYFNDQD
jgi:glycerophosphoryl diester phosphodiesterase